MIQNVFNKIHKSTQSNGEFRAYACQHFQGKEVGEGDEIQFKGNKNFKLLPHLGTFVPESHQIDFYQQLWWLFSGIHIKSEVCLTFSLFVFICYNHPVYFTAR